MRGNVQLYDLQVIIRGFPVSPLSFTSWDLTPRLALVSNVAEQLIEKGLASVVKHKRDDEDRSPDFDKLVVAEHT